jgi:hypothetical protein
MPTAKKPKKKKAKKMECTFNGRRRKSEDAMFVGGAGRIVRGSVHFQTHFLVSDIW